MSTKTRVEQIGDELQRAFAADLRGARWTFIRAFPGVIARLRATPS